MAGCWDRILRALDDLTATELRRLKATLNRLPVAPGYDTIPWGPMEKAHTDDLTRLLIGRYGEGYGVEVTAEALRRIHRRDLALRLVGEDAPSSARPLDDLTPAAAVAPSSPAERFVTRHRVALVQRVRRVAALLDLLQEEGVLTTEEVATVAAGPTPQEQMRRLLATAPAWGHRGHGQFLKAMRCLHPCLMEELGRGEDLPEGE